MARKRGSSDGAGYASTVTSGVLICLTVAVALLGYIRLKDDLHRMEVEIGRLDRALAQQERARERLRLDYETMVSSAGLDQRVREMRLNLVMPGESARVVLPEPPREAAPHPRMLRDEHWASSHPGRPLQHSPH